MPQQKQDASAEAGCPSRSRAPLTEGARRCQAGTEGAWLQTETERVQRLEAAERDSNPEPNQSAVLVVPGLEEFVNLQGLLSSKWFGISSVQFSSLVTGLSGKFVQFSSWGLRFKNVQQVSFEVHSVRFSLTLFS